MENITLFDLEKNKKENFNTFCQTFCNINEPVRQFYVKTFFNYYFYSTVN